MKCFPLVAALLAAPLLMAVAPAVSAEPCVDEDHYVRLPEVSTPDRWTPGVDQPGKDVTVDPPRVGPLDVDPLTVSIPGFTIDPVHVPGVTVYDGEDLWIEFQHCL